MTHQAEQDILNDLAGLLTAKSGFTELAADGSVRRRASYRQLMELAWAVGGVLDDPSIPPHSTIMIICDRPLDAFMSVLAVWLRGHRFAIFAHPSPKLSIDQFAETLSPGIKDARPERIIASAEFAQTLGKLVSVPVIVLSAESASVGSGPRLVDGIAQVSLPSPLFLQYSSGTTGAKKATCIGAESLRMQIDAYASEIDLAPSDVIVNWLPYYHDMGLLTGLLMPMLRGVPVVGMSPFDWVSRPAMYLEAVSEHRGSLGWLPNFAYLFMAHVVSDKERSGLDLSTLRGLVNCSEPVTQPAFDAFHERFAPSGFRPEALAVSYAMAETTFAVTSGGFGSAPARRSAQPDRLTPGGVVKPGSKTIVSSGRPIQGAEVRIIDPAGAPSADGVVGEITIRSSSMMLGYTNEEITRSAMRDGWYHSGDLGFVQDGELFVVGRAKDQIIIGGRNFFPQDVEAIADHAHGALRGRSVCFGVFDEKIGTEKAVLAVEVDSDAMAELTQIATTIRSRAQATLDLALQDIVLIEKGTLRKTTSGKIARGENKRAYLEGEMTRLTAPPRAATGNEPPQDQSPLLTDVLAVCRRVAEDPDLGPEEELLTGGRVDSLALVRLIMDLEDTFGRAIPNPSDCGYAWFDSARAIAELLEAETDAKPKNPYRDVAEREIKISRYLESDTAFDGLILGSSRSFALQPESAAPFGFTLYNFAVAGLRAEELCCALRFFSDRNGAAPRLAVIGLDPELFFAGDFPIDARFVDCRTWFDYLSAVEREELAELEDRGAANESKREKQIRRRMRFSRWHTDIEFDGRDGRLIKRGGVKVKAESPLNRQSTQQDLAQTTLIMDNVVHGLHPLRRRFFARAIEELAGQGCQIVSFDHPWPSQLIEFIPRYDEAVTRMWSFLESLEGPHYRHIRTFSTQDFGGSDTDFFDVRHIGSHNFVRLFNHIMASGLGRHAP